jgi:hypothetical protein
MRVPGHATIFGRTSTSPAFSRRPQPRDLSRPHQQCVPRYSTISSRRPRPRNLGGYTSRDPPDVGTRPRNLGGYTSTSPAFARRPYLRGDHGHATSGVTPAVTRHSHFTATTATQPSRGYTSHDPPDATTATQPRGLHQPRPALRIPRRPRPRNLREATPAMTRPTAHATRPRRPHQHGTADPPRNPRRRSHQQALPNLCFCFVRYNLKMETGFLRWRLCRKY